MANGGLSDYVKKGIEVLDNDTGFFVMVEGEKLTGPVMQMMQLQLLQILLQWMRQWEKLLIFITSIQTKL